MIKTLKLVALGLGLLMTVACEDTDRRSNPTTHYAFIQVQGYSQTYCAEVQKVTDYFDPVRRVNVTEVDTIGNVVPVVGSFEHPTQCEILESEGRKVPYYVVQNVVIY